MKASASNQKLEYIFLNSSLGLMHQDLKKLSDIASSLDDEECYSIMVHMENIKHDISFAEKAIRKKVLGSKK